MYFGMFCFSILDIILSFLQPQHTFGIFDKGLLQPTSNMHNTNDHTSFDGKLQIKKSRVRKLLGRIFKSTKDPTAIQDNLPYSNFELNHKKIIGDKATTSEHTSHLINPKPDNNEANSNVTNQKVVPLTDIKNTKPILKHSSGEHNLLGNANHTTIMADNSILDISTINDHQVVFYKLKKIYITVSALPPFKISLEPKNIEQIKAENIGDMPNGVFLSLWDKNLPPDQVFYSTMFDVSEEEITEDDSIAIFKILNKYQIAKVNPSKISCNCKHCVK